MLAKQTYLYLLYSIILLISINNIKIINSSDINTDTLTSIIRYSLDDTACSYATITTTPKGNLICSSSYFQSSTKKFYYGLKPNGRPYFIKDNKESEFFSTDSDKDRNEGNIYGIQLSSSSDDKEYIIAIGNNQANVEVYDFSEETAQIYLKAGSQFFSSEYNSFKYSTLLKLKNGDNIYLLSVILQFNEGGSYKFFSLFKFSFSSPDIENNNPIIKSFKFKSATLSFTSCFETDSNYIICFCISEQNVYTIASFDYEINNVINYHFVQDGMVLETIFYKCMHFVGNTGIFAYVNNAGKICFEFIKYENSAFSGHFSNNNLNLIQIDNSNYNLKINVEKCDLIKISDKKFVFITVSSNGLELHFYMFNNFIDEKIALRHYTLLTNEKNNFAFGQELRATFYNDYIGLATVGYLNSNINYAYLILFSYPNSIDFSMDITETIKNSENPIINFNEKCKIENNVFGYESSGITLLEISNGLKLLKESDKSDIGKNSIFNDNGELILENDIDLNSNLRIEYAMVVKDASYDLFKDYSEIYDITLCKGNTDTCDEETYYVETNHIGRTSYCDIIIDSTQISKDCEENCLICLSSNKECLFCKDTFIKSEEDTKKCLTEISQTPTTIPKVKSTIINEIIPTSLIKEIPSTQNVQGTEKKETELNTEEIGNNNCTTVQILNNKCLYGQITLNQMDEIKNMLLNLNYSGENTIIETETVIIQLSKLEDQMNQDNSNVSNIDLGDCEDILRETNHISDNEDLIIYKTDIKTSDSSTTFVTYEVYDSSLNKLNLSACSSTQISINVPVRLDDSLDNLAKSLSDSGYNLFDENDSFYNDICATYTSENGTDMLLSDRKSDIYSSTQNQTLCQTGCELASYNSTSKKAKCNCDIETSTLINTLNIDNLFDKKEIAKSFYDTLTNSNFRVMKCYNLLLDFSLIFKNYGEIIMTILIFIFLIMMIIYFILGTKQIHKFLITILRFNSQSGYNKKNKFDKESVANSENKKIIELNKTNKNKQAKKIKFSSINFPPKKRHKETDNKNIDKNKNQKIIMSNSDTKHINEENNGFNKLKNKKHKNKIKEEKVMNTIKDHETKKTIQITEDITNRKHFSENYNDYRMKNLTENELDDLDYELALIYDKRTFFQFYWSVLKQNQLLIFTFLPMNDFNLIYAKIALFIISFGLFFTINGFFFSDDTMHKVYEDNGEYDIIYQIPQIFYSSIVSSLANVLLRNLSLSEKNILELKSESYLSIHKAKKKARQIEKCLKIKLIIFFLISLLLMIFFWYFISCFCAVYNNTQIILIKDTGISFVSSMVYPFILSFLPGIFRIPALRAKDKNRKCVYKFSYFINMLI